jgi:hypothetical protein
MPGLSILFFCLLFSLKGIGSPVLPDEGSNLNYRLIGFSAISADKMNHKLLQIADGNFYSEDSFTNNIIKTVSFDTDKIITEVPFWAHQYTWRIISPSDTSKTAKSALHHFSTSFISELDTSRTRLRIIHTTDKYNGDYVFLDHNRVMYDMKGNPVWFLPDKVFKPFIPANTMPDLRDLKLSCKGTITFLLNAQAFEINYDGDILWRGPNTGEVGGSGSERYNHQFTRLSSGHYMVMGQEKGVLWPPGNKNGNNSIFGTIIEYDEDGKVIWSWKSSNYFVNSDLVYYHTIPVNYNNWVSAHENAFHFDEENKIIYISCRDISRIVKIKYPEGNVLKSYGQIFKPGYTGKEENNLFCNQHCINKLKNGNLFLFNNNTCDSGSPPQVVILKEDKHAKLGLKKIWDYSCSFDQDFSKIDKKAGGNVIELPDSSIFVSMGGDYCRIFVINMKKEILWDALPEVWNVSGKTWQATDQYRCSIATNHKDIEKLIWAR